MIPLTHVRRARLVLLALPAGWFLHTTLSVGQTAVAATARHTPAGHLPTLATFTGGRPILTPVLAWPGPVSLCLILLVLGLASIAAGVYGLDRYGRDV